MNHSSPANINPRRAIACQDHDAPYCNKCVIIHNFYRNKKHFDLFYRTLNLITTEIP